MLRCAILGAQGLYALYRKADLRCWLPALRSPLFIWHFRYNDRRHAASTSMYVQLRNPWRTWPVRVIPKGRTCAAGSQHFAVLCLSAFICHFRYNARRHAASTSMYAQLRHPWRTWPVRVIPKGRFTLLASCSSQSFVYLPLSIQRSQARSKYIHVCSAAPSLAHKACTRYTERRTCAAGSQLSALGSRLSALGSRLPAPSSQLPAPSSQLPAPNSQPSIFQTIIHPRLNSRTQVLLFSYNQVQLSFKVPVRKL